MDVTVPPVDSPELKRARGGVEALQEEETLLLRARDDIMVTQARLEGELASEITRDGGIRAEIDTAGVVLNYANELDQIDSASRALAGLEQQKAQRTHVLGEVMGRQQQIQAAVEAIERELADRTQEIGAAGQRLGIERDNEPAIFGKDDWRKRVQCGPLLTSPSRWLSRRSLRIFTSRSFPRC